MAVLAGWALALALALPGIARLELRTDGRALVPPRAPAVLADQEIRRTFGRRDPLLVLVEPSHPDGVYKPPGDRAARRALPGLPSGRRGPVLRRPSPPGPAGKRLTSWHAV